MSRMTLALVFVVSLANSSQAFGHIGLGLPLLFGTDTEFVGGPAQPSTDRLPTIDELPVIGSEEVQEPSSSRAEQAKECLKAWRKLIAEGRFDLAPSAAAKAVALDPKNIDARHALVVSQVPLETYRKEGQRPTLFAATPMVEPISPNPKPQPRRDGFALFEETTIDEAIVKASLKHMFPDGLLSPPKSEEHRATVAKSCESSQCQVIQSAIRQIGGISFQTVSQACCQSCVNCKTHDAPMPKPLPTNEVAGGIALTSTCQQAATPASKRVTVKAAGWQIECDRVVRMDDREMVLDGDVKMTRCGRDVSVQAGRVVVNVEAGTIRVGE